MTKQKAERCQNNNDASKCGGISGHKGATQKFIPQKSLHHRLSDAPNTTAQTLHKHYTN